MWHMIQLSTALPLTLTASHHLPASLLLPINPKGSVCGADPPAEVPRSNSRCEHPPSLSLCLSHTLFSPTSTTSHPPLSRSPSLPCAATSFPFPFLVKKSQTEAGRRTFHQCRQEIVFGSLCARASSRRRNGRLSINNSMYYIFKHTHTHI